MNAKQRNDAVEAVSGIVGATAIVGLVWLVYTGRTTFGEITPILIGIVSAAGVYESGRRRGKKAQALETLFDMATDFASGDESSSESTQATGQEEKSRVAETSDTDPREDPKRPEERNHPDVSTPSQPDTPKAPDTSGTSGNDGVSEPAEEGSTSAASTSSKGTDRYLDQEATKRIQEANHRTLQKVGGQLEGVDGSGRNPMPLSEQLQQIDPSAVINAFDAVEDDAFQLEK